MRRALRRRGGDPARRAVSLGRGDPRPRVSARLAPDAAWRLSLVEARLILGRAGPPPPGRGDLARLMALFPDSILEG